MIDKINIIGGQYYEKINHTAYLDSLLSDTCYL